MHIRTSIRLAVALAGLAFASPSQAAATKTTLGRMCTGTFSNVGDVYTLDLGTIGFGTGPLTISLGVLNAAIGPADAINGNFEIAGDSAFTNLGFGDRLRIDIGEGREPAVAARRLDRAQDRAAVIAGIIAACPGRGARRRPIAQHL